MTAMHRTSIVIGATLGQDVRIGPYAIIEPGAIIGDGCEIMAHATICGGTVLGRNVQVFYGAVIGKPPARTGTLSRVPSVNVPARCGDGVSIGCHAVVYAGAIVCHGVLVADGASIREDCEIGPDSVIGRYVTINYNVRVGSRVKIMDHSWLAGNMSVGDEAFISGGVLTANDNSLRSEGYDPAHVIGPRIGARARIGAGAILLPNIDIGEEAIVAAGAVVTRSVASGAEVRGIPARRV